MPSVVAEVGSTANNYDVLAKLATGGMAEIFLARGRSVAGVERYVVLKRILRDRATDAHFVQMFLEEARLAAQLQHPNVAQVYDIGKLGDSYFFTMEYVHGETVRQLLHRARSLRRDLPLGIALTLIAGAAAGLHHAHDRIGVDGRPLGIVHRDISPSNLMISYEGTIKVVDFGVAKAENRAHETKSGAVKGKISYLSPEQCRGAPLDRRSDLFSLGIVAWELLTGQRLYRRGNDFDTMSAIITEPPPPPSTYREGLPQAVDALLSRLLAKSVEARFQTADEVVDAIEELAGQAGEQLSQKAVGRFLRELFGQRPEPWIELEQGEVKEGVTVTSEPIPPELIANLNPVDRVLGNVHDLSPRKPASESVPPPISTASPPIATSSQFTAPVAASGSGDMLATVPMRAAAPLSYPPAPYPPAHDHGTSAESLAAAAAAPLSYPRYEPTIGPASSYSESGYGAVAPPRRRNVVLIAVIGVAVVGGSVAAYVVTRGGPAEPVAAAPMDSQPDQANDAMRIAAVADAGIVADAGVTTAVDAAATRTSVDAAQPPAGRDASVVADAARSPRSRSTRIAEASAAGRFEDVVRECRAGVTSTTATACTLAACRTRDGSHARAWLRRVASTGREDVAAACAAAGLELSPPRRPPPPTKPPDAGTDCLADPMACQR